MVIIEQIIQEQGVQEWIYVLEILTAKQVYLKDFRKKK